MLKLFKYYKRYWLLFLIALACIFGQAQSELALPDYMSDIVSNGIQAGGFKDSVADVLSVTTYDHLLSVSTSSHKKTIQKSYKLVKHKDLSSQLKKTFPKAGDLYVLKDNVDHDKLNDAMIKGMLIVNGMSGNNVSKSMVKKLSKSVSTAQSKINDGKKSYNKGKKKFDDGKKQYQKGLAAYHKNYAKFKKGITSYNKGVVQLNKAKAQYQKGVAQLNKGKAQYQKGVAQFNKGKAQYQKGVAQLNKGKAQYQKGLASYNKGLAQYQSGLKQYQNGVKQYNSLKSGYEKLSKVQSQYEALTKQINATTDPAAKAQLEAQANQLKAALSSEQSKKVLAARASLSTMKTKLDTAKAKLTSAKTKLDQAKTKLATAKKKLDVGEAKLAPAKKKFEVAEAKLAAAKKQITTGEAKLAAGKKQLDAGEQKLKTAKVKIDQGKKQFATAKTKLDKAKKGIDKGEKKLAEAKTKLDDGQKKVDEMKKALDDKNYFYFIDQMSTKQKNKMFKNIDKQMKTMGTSTMNIAGGRAVKSEFKALGADTDQIQHQYIITAGIKMVIIAALGAVVTIAAAFFASKIGAGVARDLRLALFKKVESFSHQEMDHFSTASLITRSTNDITQIQTVLVLIVRLVFYAPILGIGALLHALESSVSMTWTIAAVIVVIMGIMLVIFAVAMPKFKIMQTLIDKLNLSMRENLNGVLVIRAFGNEKESERRFDDSNKNLTKVNLFVNRVIVSLIPIMMFIMNGFSLLIVYTGAHQIDKGNIQIGEMMAFLQYGMMIIMAFLMIAMIAMFLPRAGVSAVRIAEVLNTEPAIKDDENPQDFDDLQRGRVVFDDVTFTYPGSGSPALEHISFTAEPGKTTAFIGSTGSGKSTLINLIPRFYDVTEGSVSVSGVDVRHADLFKLREEVGMVPQKGLLFSGTVKSNVAYGAKEVSDEDVEMAIDVSQSREFVDKLPEGEDSPIAQGGTNVSGGQRQRLAIARALAKRSHILVFDDSFSALDFKTDAKLRHELKKMSDKDQSTVLIVGQRIASIMDADQIIVLDEGRIVGKGTHKELMETCEVYKEIAYSQLSKEELDNE